MIEISVLGQFAKYPFGRYRSDGPYSGERFREEILEPALKSGETVRVVLDGAIGLGSSFLEEAFGGLVRVGYSAHELSDRLEVISAEDPALKTEISGYIADADNLADRRVRALA